MPRRSTQSQHSLGGGNNHDASAMLIQQILRKETDYREGIEEHFQLSKSLASRLVVGGDFESMLPEKDMADYRNHLKRLAEQNVEKERRVTAYVNALQVLAEKEDIKDFQKSLEHVMEQEMDRINEEAVEVHQEPKYLGILEKLGESKRPEDNDDEDLQVLPVGGNADGASLKCPLMGSLLEDPMKSKVCGHVYSKVAILDHMQKSHRNHCRCPVAGCNNSNITNAQLEPDMETANLVRRERIRQQHSQQLQSQNAIDMDDDDDDE